MHAHPSTSLRRHGRGGPGRHHPLAAHKAAQRGERRRAVGRRAGPGRGAGGAGARPGGAAAARHPGGVPRAQRRWVPMCVWCVCVWWWWWWVGGWGGGGVGGVGLHVRGRLPVCSPPPCVCRLCMAHTLRCAGPARRPPRTRVRRPPGRASHASPLRPPPPPPPSSCSCAGGPPDPLPLPAHLHARRLPEAPAPGGWSAGTTGTPSSRATSWLGSRDAQHSAGGCSASITGRGAGRVAGMPVCLRGQLRSRPLAASAGLHAGWPPGALAPGGVLSRTVCAGCAGSVTSSAGRAAGPAGLQLVHVCGCWLILTTHYPCCPPGQVLTHILDGLADEAEGVRDAALSAGRIAVELYAQSALPLILPAVEDGILSNNWRIRQSSVELLGDLLFKVGGKAIAVPNAGPFCSAPAAAPGGSVRARSRPLCAVHSLAMLVAGLTVYHNRCCVEGGVHPTDGFLPTSSQLPVPCAGGWYHRSHPAGPAQRGGGGHQRGGARRSHHRCAGTAEVRGTGTGGLVGGRGRACYSFSPLRTCTRPHLGVRRHTDGGSAGTRPPLDAHWPRLFATTAAGCSRGR